MESSENDHENLNHYISKYLTIMNCQGFIKTCFDCIEYEGLYTKRVQIAACTCRDLHPDSASRFCSTLQQSRSELSIFAGFY